MSERSSMSLLTSRIFGILWMVTFSEVKSTAQSICSASFFAPCGVISPLRRCPPSTLKEAMCLSAFFVGRAEFFPVDIFLFSVLLFLMGNFKISPCIGFKEGVFLNFFQVDVQLAFGERFDVI